MNVKEILNTSERIAKEVEAEQPACQKNRTYTMYAGEHFIKMLDKALDNLHRQHQRELLKQNVMNETVLQRIIAFVIGHKYYANIIRTKGLGGTVDLTSFIHPTKADALAHRRDIEQTASYSYVETISFRSRETYVKTFSPDGVRTGQQIK